MKAIPLRLAIAIALLFCSVDAPAELLWEIGKADNGNREFALAPKSYEQFGDEGFYVVGRSDPRRDWPYVHPGPHDQWAGGRQHTFVILFGLKEPLKEGECRLLVDLIDAQQTSPPRLRIDINGQSFERSVPKGGGDASVKGDPAKGQEHRFEVSFSASLLSSGGNEISITTLSGSWMLYDCLGLDAPGAVLADVEGTVLSSVRAPAALIERDGNLLQPLEVNVRHFGRETAAAIHVDGKKAETIKLTKAADIFHLAIPSAPSETLVNVDLVIAGQKVTTRKANLKPVRKLLVYVLPHSHTDIGYTESQFEVEEKQVHNLIKAMEYARRTECYPPGAQFKWNVEVLWAAECYLRRLSAEQRTEFVEAVKKGWVSLNGMYLNELTGLCRPEELLRLFHYATQLARECDTTIDSAMISDVPGYTWATVTAMAHAGIKYFSTAPNFFDRIGDILVQWENKPFYWLSPSSRERVLVWIPHKGYALSHIIRKLSPEYVEEYQAHLERSGYPYDIAYLRWSGHGDNAEPDPVISEFVKAWNTKYAWPRFVISSTSEAFRAFEARYGKQLPEVRGDWTPYWEDGAGSSAAETALNRNSSDRLAQAETLWAMLSPGSYPAPAFADAWRNTLLYSEHTWGAWCSVSDPENAMTKEQWETKRSYAAQADAQSRGLLERALASDRSEGDDSNDLELFNSTSWARSEVVLLPKALSSPGNCVTSANGKAAPSQRLRNGQLAFLSSEVPPLGGQRFTVVAGEAAKPSAAAVADAQARTLDNGIVHVRVDEKTGAIVELRAHGFAGNFVDASSGHALNDYLFLAGDNLQELQRNGLVTVSVKEKGPLVASLLIESDAPGCNRLSREIILVAGRDYVEIVNTVDKKRAESNPKPGDWSFAQKGGKESVNFAFPFNVPDGELRLEIPFAVIRPEIDQMPSACKNWYTIGRWADVSNPDYGVTWVTLDAPLVQVGGITANLLGSQNNPQVWRKKTEHTRRIYSWAMNNHWGTNYRAYQDGPVRFRFVLRPHRGFHAAEASRFAIGFSQPLIPRRARGPRAESQPLLRVEPADVLVTALKPSDDGRALIVRLFGASGKTTKATISWLGVNPRAVSLSDMSERPTTKLSGPIDVQGYGLVTLRAELDPAAVASATAR